jgi:hypothetical protein
VFFYGEEDGREKAGAWLHVSFWRPAAGFETMMWLWGLLALLHLRGAGQFIK